MAVATAIAGVRWRSQHPGARSAGFEGAIGRLSRAVTDCHRLCHGLSRNVTVAVTSAAAEPPPCPRPQRRRFFFRFGFSEAVCAARAARPSAGRRRRSSLPSPADWRRHSVRGTGWAGRKAVVLASMPADGAAHAAAFHSAATGVAGVAAITGSAAQLLSRSRARDSAHAQGRRQDRSGGPRSSVHGWRGTRRCGRRTPPLTLESGRTVAHSYGPAGRRGAERHPSGQGGQYLLRRSADACPTWQQRMSIGRTFVEVEDLAFSKLLP